MWLTQATCDIILTQVIWTKYLATDRGFDITAADEDMPHHSINMTTQQDLHNENNTNWTKTCVVYNDRHFTVQTPTAIPEDILTRTTHAEPSNIITYMNSMHIPTQQHKRKKGHGTPSQTYTNEHKRPRTKNATRKRRNNASNTDNEHSDSKKQKLQDETKQYPTQQQLLITNFVVPTSQTLQYPISTTPDHNDLGVT